MKSTYSNCNVFGSLRGIPFARRALVIDGYDLERLIETRQGSLVAPMSTSVRGPILLANHQRSKLVAAGYLQSVSLFRSSFRWEIQAVHPLLEHLSYSRNTESLWLPLDNLALTLASLSSIASRSFLDPSEALQRRDTILIARSVDGACFLPESKSGKWYVVGTPERQMRINNYQSARQRVINEKLGWQVIDGEGMRWHTFAMSHYLPRECITVVSDTVRSSG